MNTKDFKKIVLPMSEKLYNFARLLLHDDAEAEDAVQEVFIKLWNKRKDMKTINNIEAFSMRMTKNWCLDRIKAKKPMYVDDYSKGFDNQVSVAVPDKILENSDKVNLVYEVMSRLPEQQRMIIQLRDIEGYEYKEIAEVLEINETAIRVNLSRARNKIRETLTKTESYGCQGN